MLYGAGENEAETLIECMHEMNAATRGMKEYEKQTD